MLRPPKNCGPVLVMAIGLLLCLSMVPRAAQQAEEQSTSPVVARGAGLSLTKGEIIPVLLDRFGDSAQGRDLKKLLISARLLRSLAEEKGVTIDDTRVRERWEELERVAVEAGVKGGIAAELASRGLSAEEFREYLYLQMLQEQFTREALGLEGDATVSPDQQEIWLAQTMVERGLEEPPPPWTDGVVARCNGQNIGVEEFGEMLFGKLDSTDVRETAWHCLLLKGIEKRMPDLAADARRAAVTVEMQRRRREAESQVTGRGISFEEILRARGLSLAGMTRDPSVQVAALSRLWVDRTMGAEGLRKTYEEERDFFEGRHGMAVRCFGIFLVAGKHKNELVQRDFEEAETKLDELAGRIAKLEEFVAYAAQETEDQASRQARGDLGWITREDPRFPKSMRERIFQEVDHGTPIEGQGHMLGRVRLETGCILLWAAATRPSPAWEVMSELVHEELRRRFLTEILPDGDLEMVLRTIK